MTLRQSLEPVEPESSVIEELKTLAGEIEEGLYAKRDMAEEIDRFNEVSGGSVSRNDFLMYSGSTTLESFVKQACVVRTRVIPDISREELIELVRRIASAEGEDWQQHYYLALLQANVPDPAVSDLIFFSEESLTHEEIVDRALEFKAQPMPAKWD